MNIDRSESVSILKHQKVFRSIAGQKTQCSKLCMFVWEVVGSLLTVLTYTQFWMNGWAQVYNIEFIYSYSCGHTLHITVHHEWVSCSILVNRTSSCKLLSPFSTMQTVCLATGFLIFSSTPIERNFAFKPLRQELVLSQRAPFLTILIFFPHATIVGAGGGLESCFLGKLNVLLKCLELQLPYMFGFLKI